MPDYKHRKHGLRGGLALTAGGIAAGLALATSGCGRSDSESARSRPSSTAAQPATPGATIPAPEVPDDANTLADAFPRLASGTLAYARLVRLPGGALLQAESLKIGRADLDAELQGMPQMHREMMRRHEFVLLEQIATDALLELEARQDLSARGREVAAMSRDELLET